MESTRDEPLTPSGRLFLRPYIDLTINCAIGLKHPLNAEALKSEISNSIMMKQPRFNSLLVVDQHGKEFWRRTDVNFDEHIIIHPKNTSLECYSDEEQEDKINEILADFAVSSPLSTEKPLWEVHIYCDLKCMIYRLHHALGDGITLMSLFLADCKTCNDGNGKYVSEKNRDIKGERKKKEKGIMGMLRMLWWSLISLMELIGRSLWVKDQKTDISGGEEVQLWPRTVATAKFSLEDMKTVKRTIPNATINDVLFGIISLGLSKYLNIRSSKALKEGLQITGLSMVNLRKQPGLQEISKLKENDSDSINWGNKFGYMVIPIYYHTKEVDPLNYIKRAKVMIDKKKQSLEAYFSYNIGMLLLWLFGLQVACKTLYRIFCNTTFMISNMVGPQEDMTFAGNPIAFMRPITTSLPFAITLHMMSCAGRVDMQMVVAKDIIPNPKLMAKCFEDALLEMKNAAVLP